MDQMNEFDEVEKLVLNSGNNFHSKVLNHFKENDWSVLISPYYNDNLSDKPREIDLIAEKAFKVTEKLFNHFRGTVNVKLFIECKYVPQKIAFWFYGKDKNKAQRLIVDSTPLRENNSYTQKHHYLNTNDRVAKLFASESKKNEENEIIYKAINQSLNAMVYFREGDSILPLKSEGRDKILATVNYPLIVCNNFNTFYRVEMDSKTTPSRIDDHFQLELHYAYMDVNKNHKNEYFLIDVVNFEQISRFINLVETDVDAIAAMVS